MGKSHQKLAVCPGELGDIFPASKYLWIYSDLLFTWQILQDFTWHSFVDRRAEIGAISCNILFSLKRLVVQLFQYNIKQIRVELQTTQCQSESGGFRFITDFWTAVITAIGLAGGV